MVEMRLAIGRGRRGIKPDAGAGEDKVRKLIAGNWKMNGSLAALGELDAIADAAHASLVDVAVCPPSILIPAAVARCPRLTIGAQDCHWAAKGAYTGCVSVAMLAEAGARMVIVGHSERRADNHESDGEVRLKAEAALSGGLQTILCVGETQAERDRGDAVAVVARQLRASFPSNVDEGELIIAYEPVWAIGTGRTPQPADIAEMHGALRAVLADLAREAAWSMRILYGGSVNPENAGAILSLPNVDGALVGGASLKAAQFVPIIEAAEGLA